MKGRSGLRRCLVMAAMLGWGFPAQGDPPEIVKGPYLQLMAPDAVTIMWETDVLSSGQVHYFTGDEWDSVIGPAGTTIHEIRIGGFLPAQEIAYYVESTADAGGDAVQSSQAVFHTAPLPGTPFRMCVWGDNQNRPQVFSQHVTNMILDQPDLLLCCGDVVSTGSVYRQWEERFLGPLRPLIQDTPMIVAIGNHEGDSHWFYDLLAQPGNEHWFSYTYGNAFFLILDTNYPFTYGTEQYDYAQNALLSDDAQNATWIFVAHHHPGYSEIYEEGKYAQIRQHLIPMFEWAGVDINFHGHIHDYERGEFVPPEAGRRIWQVQTSGGGGTLWDDEFDGEWEQIDLVIQYVYHYCVVDVGETELTLRAIDLDGVEIDAFTISAQSRNGKAPPDPGGSTAGPTQWDFTTADLAASYGPGRLEFYDGPVGPTAQQTVFGTTTALGIPDIGGEPANVMGFPKAVDNSMGFRVYHEAPPNGGGSYVNEYTLVFDLLITQSTFTNEDWLAFHNTNAANENDADVFVRLSDGGIGISGQYDGMLLPDTWHRVALVFAATADVELVKYIDGAEVGRQDLGGLDGRWSLYSSFDATPWFFLFTDDSGETAPAYVSSVHFVDRAMEVAEIAALGAPDADGIADPPYSLGDANCDGALDGFDIDPFALIVVDVPPYDDYYARYPHCDYRLADINQDGAIDGFDIDPFVDLLLDG